MNNQNDDINNHQLLQKIKTNNIDLTKIEYPRENNNQKSPIITHQETNEVNYQELSSSTSSPLSSANNSISSDINKQDLSLLEKFSDTSLSSPFSSGNEKLTPEKRSIYIPQQDRNDLTLECINKDVNYGSKVNKFA